MSNPNNNSNNPIVIRTMKVQTGRLVCEIEIKTSRFRWSTPGLAAFVTGQYSDLSHHVCLNDQGQMFGDVIEHTSVPHLLEHLVISEQVRITDNESPIFVGTTEWIDESAGIACIEVGFCDDLVALRAFTDATRFLNMAVLTCLT